MQGDWRKLNSRCERAHRPVHRHETFAIERHNLQPTMPFSISLYNPPLLSRWNDLQKKKKLELCIPFRRGFQTVLYTPKDSPCMRFGDEFPLLAITYSLSKCNPVPMAVE